MVSGPVDKHFLHDYGFCVLFRKEVSNLTRKIAKWLSDPSNKYLEWPWVSPILLWSINFFIKITNVFIQTLFTVNHFMPWASLLAQTVKNQLAMQETWVRSLGWEDDLEKGMTIHSSILAWRSPKDRRAWWATVYEVAKSQTRPSD